MKTQNRKVIQAVMKSPSPDIAHRSIIANTKSPVNEIKEYIKMRQSSTSPKSMTTSFHQISKSFSSENDEIARLKRIIQQLEGKIKFFEKMQISHDQLVLINQSLTNQIAQMKVELRQQRQRSHSNTSSIKNISPNNVKPHSPKNGGKGVSLVRNSVLNANPQIHNISQQTQNDSILRQFNERIVKMSQENKRLTKKLKEIKDERDYLERQNSLIRIKGVSEQRQIPHYILSLENDSLKKYFADEVDRISAYYQRINEDKIAKLGANLGEVEAQLTRAIQKKEKKIYTRSNTPNELKANLSMETNIRSDNQEEGPSSLPANRYNMVESKYTTSPSEFKAFTLDTSPIRVLEEEKDRVKRENYYLAKKASQLEKDLRNALMTNDSMEKRLKKLEAQAHGDSQEKKTLSDSNFSLYKTVQQRNENLQSQIAKKNAYIAHNENKIHQLEENLTKLKEHNEVMNKDYTKNIDQERQKGLKYLQDTQNLQAQIAFFEQNYLAKEKYFYLEKQLKQLKDSYNRYKVDFERYLEMVLEIRYSITGEGVEQCLKEVENRWEGYDDLEVEIVKVHECYEALLQNFKKNLLEKEQKIAQLQRDNQVLAQTNQQTRIQLEKLEKAVRDYKQPMRSTMSEEQLRKRMASHQQSSGTKSRNNCQIREYINQTVTKISSLQNEIQMAIKGNFTQKTMGTSLRYREQSPANVDSVYRTGKGKTSYYKGDYDYHEQSDPQHVEDENIYIPHQ